MGRIKDFLERFANPERYKEKLENERLRAEENLRQEEEFQKARAEAEKKREGNDDN